MNSGIKLAVLRKRESFLAVAKNGRKWVAPGLILQAGATHNKETPLNYGLTASSKVGPAVTRNRARRRLRALVMGILPRHALPGRDYVVIARAATITRDFPDLQQDLMTALKKLGAWRD